MELTDMETLRLIQERICVKVSSFRDWPSFVDWVRGVTAEKFKAFVLVCFEDVVTKSDLRKADLLEAKTQIEEDK